MALKTLILNKWMIYKQCRSIINSCSLCYSDTTIFHTRYRRLHHTTQNTEEKFLIKDRIKNVIDKNFTDTDVIDPVTKFLFPSARMTLNELTAKQKDKIFDIHFKHHSATSKEKKYTWTCTYSFIWPEKAKFESTAISKKQAAEKAGFQALQWLYINKHIDKKGNPIIEKPVLNDIKKKENEPIPLTINASCVGRIKEISKEYHNHIEEIFKMTHERALARDAEAALASDSVMDDAEETDSDGEENPVVLEEQDTFRMMHPLYGYTVQEMSQYDIDSRQGVLKYILNTSSETLAPLPIDSFTNEICSTLEQHNAIVLVGAPGCGKSTRTPRAILSHWGAQAYVMVAEPRRVAALGLAGRVADELKENIGNTVGYKMRLKEVLPAPTGGSILFCTSGILLRRLQTNPGLDGCTHVIIDEAHERDVNTDIILLMLKRALTLRPDLKVVIMSATLDIGVFRRFFGSCPVIEVPGRTFPVETVYVEEFRTKLKGVNVANTLRKCHKAHDRPQVDYQEVVNVIKAVDANEAEGAILVFLPGWADIKNVLTALQQQLGNSGRHLVLPVHSRLTTEDQEKIFARPIPGIRKIVLSTNIAETSITIPDVVYVIDSGTHKETRLRANAESSLQCVWVSKAAAKQRSGRAGRVQPGVCYKMYTREKEAEFVAHNTSEILRVPLEHTVLNCKFIAPEETAEAFLSQLPEPPSKKSIQHAIDELVDIGALSAHNESLTRLGQLLNKFTVHPRLGCMLLQSAVTGNVVSVSNMVAQLSTDVDIFNNSIDRKNEIRAIRTSFDSRSDHVALHRVQEEYDNMREESDRYHFCHKYGLRRDRLHFYKAISEIYLQQLLKSNIVKVQRGLWELNRFTASYELTKAILLWGSNKMMTSQRRLKNKSKTAVVKVLTSGADRVHIGPESVNYALNKKSKSTDILTYYGGYHSLDRRALMVHKTSLINPHTALLYSTSEIVKETLNNGDVVISIPNHNLKFSMKSSDADLLLTAKEMIQNTFNYFVERNDEDLDYEIIHQVANFRVKLFEIIADLLSESEKSIENVEEEKLAGY